jgi:hypothetical protein
MPYCKNYFLFAALMYFLMASTSDGFSGVGANIFMFNLWFNTPSAVVFPKIANLVSSCLNAGKLVYKESMADGLKKTSISYLTCA